MSWFSMQREFIVLWGFLIVLNYFLLHSSAENVIMQGQTIKDGDDEPLISKNGEFSFGFFSTNENVQDFRYVGIWYTEKPLPSSVVWVANKEKPSSSGNGVITITNGGNLEVLDGNGASLWSTNLSVSSNMNSSVELNDSGNLIVLRTQNGTTFHRPVWQSFNDTTDTFLPGMRVYVDDQVDEERYFSSWKSSTDPSVGNFSMGIDSHRSPQIVIWEGQRRVWRSGYWTGLVFTGIPTMRADYLYGFKLNNDNERKYFSYTPNSLNKMKFRVAWDGHGEQQSFNEGLKQWEVIQKQPANDCFIHNRCGAFGRCDQSSEPFCSCLDAFEPTDADAWSQGDWSGGCTRRVQLHCEMNSSVNIGIIEQRGGEPDGFLEIDGVKLPDYLEYVGAEDIEGCEKKCLENCSCLAYAYVIGINCMIWTSDLVDLQHFAEGGNSLFVRVAHSELATSNNKRSKRIIIVAVVVGMVALLFLSLSTWLILRKKNKMAATIPSEMKMHNVLPKSDPNSSGGFSTECSVADDLCAEGQAGSGPDLPLYQFNVIAAATGNFCEENKLGHGGFGHVYKGVLPGNQNIAVKRLSRKSTQGVEEFKNEITLIAKLQHRNLVRLLGCCIHGEEKMLIYEYMPNKSLDSFLFDAVKQTQLDWPTRFNIIEGIARGLLYLHRDSRLRIIHRDLKASNILLDEEMTPKISDFGMARIFGGNQNEANTNRVVGTYGYMAPEYAMEGLFSVKSDVYSFGILLLEVISGQRSTSYRSIEHSNLKTFAFDLWDKGKATELTDPSIVSSCNRDEVHRCIHIGMLCIQDLATHRPNMSTIVLMLESENTVALPLPRQPTITSMRRSEDEEDMWHVSREIVSSNNVTVTAIIGR
ncbi:transmembrane signal receptor [Lithospermum erythrorhizon]|uniref:Receptor-like serine/threonine-protein kinase n=1 Tax=Lithospermum erythrorhizon TaxID=34254 RepID=A0AAV3PH14_LITER